VSWEMHVMRYLHTFARGSKLYDHRALLTEGV